MINNRHLSGILALVLISGLATPAFAQSIASDFFSPTQVFTPQHGNVDQSYTGPFNTDGGIGPFFFPAGQTLTASATNLVGVDIFVTVGEPSETLTVDVWTGNTPGSGTFLGTSSVLVDTSGATEQNPQVVHFDFTSIPLVSGNTYALEFTEGSFAFFTQIAATCDDQTDPYPGGILWQFTPLPECDWGFVTYFADDTVGGSMLPIDSTALILAATQSPAAWLTTLTIAALGIGAYVFTRNSNNMRNIKVILRDYLDRF